MGMPIKLILQWKIYLIIMNENIPYMIPFGILIVNGIKQIVKNVGTISSILCISNDLNSFVICAPIINKIGADILEGIN